MHARIAAESPLNRKQENLGRNEARQIKRAHKPIGVLDSRNWASTQLKQKLDVDYLLANARSGVSLTGSTVLGVVMRSECWITVQGFLWNSLIRDPTEPSLRTLELAHSALR